MFALANTPILAQTSLVASASRPFAPMRGREFRVHDPSTIVKCDDEYWLFCTGPGISSFHSKDLEQWDRGPRVFTNAPPWAARAVPGNRGTYYWAPEILPLGHRYLLYYAVSTFGKNRSAIGLVANSTLNPDDPKFHWTDLGIVVQSTNTDNFNTIDPAVCRDASNNLWLTFGSYWGGIKLIQLDPTTGERISANSPIYSLAFNDSIEASYLYRHGDFYYLFVNWGLCCRGTNSTYEVRVGRSRKITGPYLDRGGTDMMIGGGSPFLKTSGDFIGPGQAAIFARDSVDWLSCHFYDGTNHGRPTLAILPLVWKADGWPEVKLPPGI